MVSRIILTELMPVGRRGWFLYLVEAASDVCHFGILPCVCVGHFNKIFVDIASKVAKRIESNLSGKHFTVYIHMDDVFNFPGDSSFQNLI